MRRSGNLRIWTAVAILGAALFGSASSAEAKSPVVVVTIRPINSLVASVMDGVGVPTVLIPPEESPESFVMHQQDFDALRLVDLIFWLGGSLEASLAHPFADPDIGAGIVELADTEGLLIFAPRHGGEWDRPPANRRPPGEGGGPAGADGHLWLDADNAKLLIGRIASALTDADFAHAEVYRMNAAELRRRIDALDKELTQSLAPLHDRPFLLLHDDFQYFEARYNLEAVGSIDVGSDGLSPDQLKDVAAKIARLHAVCVIGDTSNDDDTLQAIADTAKVKTVRIDLYGGEIKEAPDLYFKAMRAIGASFTACLGPS